LNTLNLLFITKDRSQRLERSSFYLSQELSKLVNLIIWSENGHIQDILKKIQARPDFILLNDYKDEYRPFVRGLETLTVPHGIIMHDMHYKLAKREMLIQKEKPSLIFSHYRDAFKKWFPNHADKLVWFPHHVPSDIFRKYHVPKDIPLLLIGATFPHLYPFRHMITQKLSQNPHFVHHSHPGYGYVRKGLAGENYAREISRAKIFLTCDSIHHFPLLKYFEVLACGTLLAAPGSQELKDLGFIDGKTFVEINEVNFKEKIDYYLNNKILCDPIIQNGIELIWKRHTTAIRAKEMVQIIQQFIANNRG
jgi:Glycosyl transferases group 1